MAQNFVPFHLISKELIDSKLSAHVSIEYKPKWHPKHASVGFQIRTILFQRKKYYRCRRKFRICTDKYINYLLFFDLGILLIFIV